MILRLAQIFSDSSTQVRAKLFGIYGLLIGINMVAWIWALVAFHEHPVLLGTALLAYGFGLRHAVDADHIAAIDNVTRKLMQERNVRWRWASFSPWDILRWWSWHPLASRLRPR